MSKYEVLIQEIKNSTKKSVTIKIKGKFKNNLLFIKSILNMNIDNINHSPKNTYKNNVTIVRDKLTEQNSLVDISKKDSKETNKELKELKEIKDVKEIKEFKEIKEVKEVKEFKEKEVKDIKETKEHELNKETIIKDPKTQQKNKLYKDSKDGVREVKINNTNTHVNGNVNVIAFQNLLASDKKKEKESDTNLIQYNQNVISHQPHKLVNDSVQPKKNIVQPIQAPSPINLMNKSESLIPNKSLETFPNPQTQVGVQNVKSRNQKTFLQDPKIYMRKINS